MQLSDYESKPICKVCENSKEYHDFLIKFNRLKEDRRQKSHKNDIGKLLEFEQKLMLSNSSKLIKCISCRLGVERFMKQISSYRTNQNENANEGYNLILNPFVVQSNGIITFKDDFIENPFDVYNLLYLNQ
jgi:hypothetical protein